MESTGLQMMLGADLAAGDLITVRDVSVTTPANKDKTITRDELIAALIANGLVKTNDDGQIVGPIIIGIYANAAAAGVLPDGTLAKVGDTLCLGDGETTGGIPQLSERIDYHSVSSGDGHITLNTNALRAFVNMAGGSVPTATVDNHANLPVGFEIVLATADIAQKIQVGEASLSGSEPGNPVKTVFVKIPSGSWLRIASFVEPA